jgi:hypothetical protein
MKVKVSEDLLNLFESLLRAQLNVIRQLRKQAGLEEVEEPKEKRKSHMDMVYDILLEAGHPMHVKEIIHRAKEKFNVELDRDSLVSAISKRVHRHDRFMRVAPNTFALIDQNISGGKS